jgi:hypothetical protein
MSIIVATALGIKSPAPMPVRARKAMKDGRELQKPLMSEQMEKITRPARVRRE